MDFDLSSFDLDKNWFAHLLFLSETFDFDGCLEVFLPLPDLGIHYFHHIPFEVVKQRQKIIFAICVMPILVEVFFFFQIDTQFI